MALAEDLERIAAAAAAPGERVTGVLAVELIDGQRVYLCAYESGEWLALDAEARPVVSRRIVHEAASISALCEVAEDVAEALGLEVEPPPRLATNAYLDELGAAARAHEAFAPAVQQSTGSVDALADEVVRRHKTPLA